jgi:hypothetical protein
MGNFTSLPGTSERVARHTSNSSNARIRYAMFKRVAAYEYADHDAIEERIETLRREWDIERVLEANAASVALVGVALGASVDRRWFALPAIVAGFLLQHAVQGWCPPLPLFRKLGVRTSEEIHEEIVALKALRGDFNLNDIEPHTAVRAAYLG